MTRVNNEYWRQDPHVINGTIKSLEIWKGLGKLQSIGLDFGD